MEAWIVIFAVIAAIVAVGYSLSQKLKYLKVIHLEFETGEKPKRSVPASPPKQAKKK